MKESAFGLMTHLKNTIVFIYLENYYKEVRAILQSTNV